MRYEMRTTLSWIPGHANIAGNKIADQLAKEAAKESMSLNEILISVNPSFNAAMQCSNTMSIATSSASSMDPLCATARTVDMFKATKVDIKLIEPEVTYKAGVDVMMMRAASYWSGLGSSKRESGYLLQFSCLTRS
jgi:hypothetical protein